MTDTTPAQTAGLKLHLAIMYYDNSPKLPVNTYHADDVDALLQSKDQQIAGLVAALENLLGAENAFDEIAAIKDARHTLNALAKPAANPRNTSPSQADTTATAGFDDDFDDDAVIAWRKTVGFSCGWGELFERQKEMWRADYAAHMREQSAKGSES